MPNCSLFFFSVHSTLALRSTYLNYAELLHKRLLWDTNGVYLHCYIAHYNAMNDVDNMFKDTRVHQKRANAPTTNNNWHMWHFALRFTSSKCHSCSSSNRCCLLVWSSAMKRRKCGEGAPDWSTQSKGKTSAVKSKTQ